MSTASDVRRSPVRILVVLGTRPEAIKLAPVILELRQAQGVDVRLATTGQHRELVDQVLTPFGIRPDVDLGLMEPGQGLSRILERALARLDVLYDEFEPRMIIVQGDTTSAFGGALAAFHRRIRVAHVEAGLRSFDRFHPFPEESNRRMISAVADLHLAPTRESAANLVREGIDRKMIVVTGNTAVDALQFALSHPQSTPELDSLSIPEGCPAVLTTLHRRESWLKRASSDGGDQGTILEALAGGLRESAREHGNCHFVFPVHPNPLVREPIYRILGDSPNVHLIEPVPYFGFAQLMARATVIVTDSGGIQEEAPSLGIPVLVLRRTTERPEGLSAANNRLVGTDPRALKEELRSALRSPVTDPAGRPYANPFGDGAAARRVCQAILHSLGRGPRPKEFLSEEGQDITTPGG